MAWGRLKGMFGPVAKGQHITGVIDLPNVQMAESSEELYQTVRQVGTGQTAMVYEGVCRADGLHYALKHFTDLRGDAEAIRAFRAEVETMRELGSHRFIVSLQEVVSTPTAAIVVMELVSGGDLLSPIEKNGPYSERRAQHVFAQIVHAVRHLHSLGIVHRDLKPENICFTTAEVHGRSAARTIARQTSPRCHSRALGTPHRGAAQLQWVKLIDLGAAGFLERDGLTDLCGTPLYAAPEVRRA